MAAMTRNNARIQKAVLALAFAALTSAARATEGGGSIYPVGAENFMAAALPPPGLYGMVFVNRYEADDLRDNSGNRVPIDFSVRANVIAPRIVWVTGQKFLGGDLGFHTIVPLVDLDVKVGPVGQQKKRGLGDITLGAVTGYHHSANLHSIVALDVFAPTGRYDKNDLANTGRNYWTIQPLTGVEYIDPKGFNGSAKLMYNFNRKNDDTHFKSGQELIVDYASGWGLGNGWVIGLGGYLYRQTTDDKQNGATVANNKGRAFAIGPSIRYDSGKGWFVTAKWQSEMGVHNRADGDAFWVKSVFPL